MKQSLVRLLYNFGKRFMGWTLHMIMCVLCYPVSIHMSQLLLTGRPISSFSIQYFCVCVFFCPITLCLYPFRQMSSLSDPRTRLLLKFCSLTVYDIPSLYNRGDTCGSVSFGETFLNSVLHIQLSGRNRY